ncbi:TIGR03086 family metal-binding protein [Rhodococcus artemisiae]|uniref:TIGR03086 family metal-binding protein n=1 Tax=Rhodococcus artemisiae TaxID=714159 RepID=A0ABU7L5I2_9NOCA|nr:TIGR03086 family metal-binding protein [Rhodococcus artemisiae]MEE2056794.1 TIGR03086 family metal-binding protein [Rhodococcus artemisiae]
MAIDWTEMQRTARSEFDARLPRITDWSAPTPDTEWTVADLVRHMVDEQRWVAPILEGRTLADAEATLEPIRDDLAAEWHRYAEKATAAWEATPLDANVHLSYGTVTCLEYLKQQVGDIAVHTWDLARAVGGGDRLNPGLVDAVWSELELQRDMLASSGLFAPPVPIADDAPVQDRLIALTGRDPRQP